MIGLFASKNLDFGLAQILMTCVPSTLIGVLVVVIRLWGGMPEGVMYAILLANAASPHIDALIQPRVFGTGGR